MTPPQDSVPPLKGLVLAGGMSTRMQEDKASLEYHGKPQVRSAAEMLVPFCESVHVSIRAEQASTHWVQDLDCFVDRFIGFGPLGGVLTAMTEHPEAAWLVLACDLPFVETETVAELVAHRNAEQLATCFAGADGLPEPLCALYEPPMRARIHEALGGNTSSLRGILGRLSLPLVIPSHIEQLRNVNTPADRQAALRDLGAAENLDRPAKHVEVQYFASLREERGVAGERIETKARTAEELFSELRDEFNFSLDQARLKVVVNEEFVDWLHPVNEGDTVVFVPPVAGG